MNSFSILSEGAVARAALFDVDGTLVDGSRDLLLRFDESVFASNAETV